MPVMAWLVLGPVEREKKKITGGEKGGKNGGWRSLRGTERGRDRSLATEREREKRYSVKRPVDFCDI